MNVPPDRSGLSPWQRELEREWSMAEVPRPAARAWQPTRRPADEAAAARGLLGRLRGLPGLGPVTARRSGDTLGLFAGTVAAPFGLIFLSELYLKASPDTVTKYLACGMRPYRPGPRQTLRGYWSVPGDVLNDPGRLFAWTLWAVADARRWGRLRRPKPRRRRSGNAAR